MANEKKLQTTLDKFNDLWNSVDRVRGKTVKLDRQDVVNLLLDHSNMYNILNKDGKIIDAD